MSNWLTHSIVGLFIFTLTSHSLGGVDRVSVKLVRNYSYFLKFSQSTVKLVDGLYRRLNYPDDVLIVRLMRFLLVDLNGDKRRDAVVILSQSGGGSGTFYEITALLTKNGEVYQTDSFVIGDRISVEKFKILKNHEYPRILLEVHNWSPDEVFLRKTEFCFTLVKTLNPHQPFQLVECGLEGR
ncbi:hypothetical protein [Thermodesulfovibrio hydrogeniphilus]